MKRLMLLFAGIFTIAMTSCSKNGKENEVTSITVEKTEITVCTKSAFNPIAFGMKIFPENVREEDLVYTTSDNSIVWLKEEETLIYRFFTGDKTGVVTLTCASADGKHKAQVRVNVVENPRYDFLCEKVVPSTSMARDGELKITVSVINKTNCKLKSVHAEWRRKFGDTSDFQSETITDIKDNKFVFEKKGLPQCVVECSFRMEFEGLVDMPGRATYFASDFMVAIPPVVKPEELAGDWYASRLSGFKFVDGRRELIGDLFKPEDSSKEGFTVYKFENVNGQCKITVSTNNADGSKKTEVIEGTLQGGTKLETKEWRVEILYINGKEMICSFARATDEGLELLQSCELKRMSE